MSNPEFTVAIHFEQTALGRRVGRHDREIDREVVREIPPQIDRLVEPGPVRFDETVPMTDSDHSVQSRLEGLERRLLAAATHREHQIEVASCIDPAGGIRPTQPGDLDPGIGGHQPLDGLNQCFSIHGIEY